MVPRNFIAAPLNNGAGRGQSSVHAENNKKAFLEQLGVGHPVRNGESESKLQRVDCTEGVGEREPEEATLQESKQRSTNTSRAAESQDGPRGFFFPYSHRAWCPVAAAAVAATTTTIPPSCGAQARVPGGRGSREHAREGGSLSPSPSKCQGYLPAYWVGHSPGGMSELTEPPA